MPYDYGRKRIARALGLTGVEAGHIAEKLRRAGVDEQAIDFEGAISDANDNADRYNAVKDKIRDYYGVSLEGESDVDMRMYQEQALNDLVQTKEGVKEALRQYYAKRGGQAVKEMIKDRLLTSEPAANVLMVALYDGADMPLAKRFLKEALGEPVPDLPPEEVFNELPPPVQEKIIKERARHFQFVDKVVDRVKNYNPQLSEKIHEGIKKFPPDINLKFDGRTERFLKTQLRDTGHKFRASAEALIGDYKKRTNPDIKTLQLRNQKLMQQLTPLQLQVEYMTLLKKREEFTRLGNMFPYPRPPTATEALTDMIFGGRQQRAEEQKRLMRSPLTREGFHVEQRVRLPKGYRWVKDKKKGA